MTLTRQASLPPLDMFIALDTSYSMDFKGKWPAVRSALRVMALDPRLSQMGVGLQYFPSRAQCKAAGYALPAVAMAPLQQAGPALVDSLDRQRMAGGTPMVPVLQGALSYARTWASANPVRKTIVLLATDGIPDSTCLSPAGGAKPNTLANVVQVAASGMNNRPRINTFVIGVGSELTALNAIARAGHTKKAFLVDTSKDIEAAFLAALDDIRRTIACEWDLPHAPGVEQKLDLTDVQVHYSDGSAGEVFTRVSGAQGCAAAKGGRGWYFDHAKAPTKVLLCPGACQRAHASDAGRITLRFGCDPVIL